MLNILISSFLPSLISKEIFRKHHLRFWSLTINDFKIENLGKQ